MINDVIILILTTKYERTDRVYLVPQNRQISVLSVTITSGADVASLFKALLEGD